MWPLMASSTVEASGNLRRRGGPFFNPVQMFTLFPVSRRTRSISKAPFLGFSVLIWQSKWGNLRSMACPNQRFNHITESVSTSTSCLAFRPNTPHDLQCSNWTKPIFPTLWSWEGLAGSGTFALTLRDAAAARLVLAMGSPATNEGETLTTKTVQIV